MNNSSTAARIRDQRGYARLFTAGIINGICDRFSGIAMLALVLHLTGSGMAVGISLGVRVLPYLILSPLGGMLGSKLPRKTIMITTDIIRVPIALIFLWVDGENRLWLLYATNFMLAAAEAIYSPVRKSSIPLLSEPGALLKINGLEQLMTGCVLILGAFAGGVVSYWFGPDMAFIMNAASFLIAAIVIYGIHFPQSAVDDNPSPEHKAENAKAAAFPSLRKSIKTLLAGSLILQIVLVYELLVPMVNGLDNVLISVYAIQEFNAGDVGVGAFYAALGIGLSLSFFAGRFIKRGLLFAALGGLLVEGLLLTFISMNGSFAAAFMLYILLSLAGGIGNACLDTLVMRETPLPLQPVVFGFITAASGTLLGISMLAAGWLLNIVEPRTLGCLGGAGFVGVALALAGYALLRSKKDGIFTVPWKTL
ncbi:MFS transporter [Paenibacillus sp. BR2-3]|uniref:MFS transporter n=1 Tax=Paenibacillus sp. BR2-3 TaxID=3048494 RepID=UPI003977B41D